MEAMLLAFDCLALFILVFFSVKDDRRPPGTPSHGPFRYIETLPAEDAKGKSPLPTTKAGRRGPYA